MATSQTLTLVLLVRVQPPQPISTFVLSRYRTSLQRLRRLRKVQKVCSRETSGNTTVLCVRPARGIGRNGESYYAGMVEWQTQWIQNPPRNREGSSPSSGTICPCGGMADTLDLGSSAFWRAGSNPVTGTIIMKG